MPANVPAARPSRYTASTVPNVKAVDLTATSMMRNQTISSESAQNPLRAKRAHQARIGSAELPSASTPSPPSATRTRSGMSAARLAPIPAASPMRAARRLPAAATSSASRIP